MESALLDAGFQVVMYDLRGHGQSAKPHDPGCYSMDAHVGDVQALAGHLSLDRPAVVGYSLGSMIAGRLLGSPGCPRPPCAGRAPSSWKANWIWPGGPILPGASVRAAGATTRIWGASAPWLNKSARISSPSAQSPGASGDAEGHSQRRDHARAGLERRR